MSDDPATIPVEVCGSFGGCKNEATEAYLVEVKGPVYRSDNTIVEGYHAEAEISGIACPSCAERHRSEPPAFRPVAMIVTSSKKKPA